MPRGGLESQLRRVDLKISVPRHLDIEIWGMTSDPVKNDAGQPFNADTNRGSFTPKRYLKRGLRSYVLLSACGEDQYARETPIGGIFTTHLLDALEAVDASTVTYVDLVNRIPCQTMWVAYVLVGEPPAHLFKLLCPGKGQFARVNA
jgi:hypothetical protein